MAILILTFALFVFLMLAGRRLGLLSPSSLFLYLQYVMAVGIITLLERNVEADRVHMNLLLFTFLAYVSCTIVVVGMLDRRLTRSAYSPTVTFEYPKKSVMFWIALSIAIGVAYYAAIGYVAFFESIKSIVSGESRDIAGLRLESYAGSQYFFPGYVNQFKNALLPALFLVVVTASFKLRKPSRWWIVLGLGSIALILLIGTGQRHPFVRALVLAVLFAYYVFPGKVVRGITLAAVVGGPLFVATTFATGRATNELESAGSILDRASIFMEQLLYRLFSSDQNSASFGFRYIYSIEDITFASDWMQALYGLLPGQPGSPIASQVFELAYGSTRGTSPPSLWGSAYYNFGFWGAVVLAGVFGVLFAFVSASFLNRRTLNLIEAAGMAGITMTLGLWISEGPTTILNSGLVVFVLLLVWGGNFRRQKSLWARRRARFTSSRSNSKLSCDSYPNASPEFYRPSNPETY